VSGWAAFIEHAPADDHAVQVYDDVGDLARSVATFLAAGFASGAPAVVIATDNHWPHFAEELEARGWDPAELERTGRLCRADAGQLLNAFMEDGLPSPERFEQVVGALIDEASSRFPGHTVRAFGEMVDVLWRRREQQAALAVEELWRELSERRSFALLCGYHLDIFDLRVQRDVLPAIFHAHSHAKPAADPPRLAAAVDQALAEVVGPVEAANIYLDVASNVAKDSLPRAQAVLGWLSTTDSPIAARVLERARSNYARLRGRRALTAF
jgi:hypothetical protein